MKKRLVSILIAAILIVSAVFVFAACDPEDKNVTELVAEAQNMTWDEIYAKAKEETGDFNAYGNTSRITTAMANFVAKYGQELGLNEKNAVGSKMNDSAIYTTLASEYASTNNSKGASMVMIQDGAQLVLYREQTKMLINYVPQSMKSKVDAEGQVPLVQQYINKLFIWNNTGDNVPSITNVWQLTEPAMKSKVFFKSPSLEQVNMNFLIMLTSDEWATKLAEAYKAYYGKDIQLGSYKNAGYKWVAEFIANANFAIDSDTTMARELSKTENAGNIGLFVLSKLRDSSVTADNLQVGAFVKENDQYVTINPFAGFMYPMYCQVAANGPRPYTALLFIEYLMTEEGFEPWGSDIGAYSSNSDIGVNDGDETLAFWKNILVFEDPDYIRANKATVVDFVTAEIDKKD
ncbi:MAG TPA: ABC transporter substrate-binding protein [Candidatus Fimimonas merdipullorum]|uniref:ABC transporter substrate-binding protein n=1 Tax=Candidatus Fimimonas merdipullorum TaxID=2840822 RepID=A0A9D1MXB4_9BACT|nr:ABC transporter substrate-binding protein [Candidatus Fimimonas merdipullorum]